MSVNGIVIGVLALAVLLLLLRDPVARACLKRVGVYLKTAITARRRLTRLGQLLFIVIPIVAVLFSVSFGLNGYANANSYRDRYLLADKKVEFLERQLLKAYNMSEIKVAVFADGEYLNIVSPYVPDLDCIILRDPKNGNAVTRWHYGYDYDESFGGFKVWKPSWIRVGQMIEITFLCSSRLFTWLVQVGG